MSRIEIDVYGLAEITSRLRKAPDKIEAGIQKGLKSVGYLIQREARKNAPYRDGDLEENISFITGRNYVDIGVPMNSPAGRYAKIMHEGSYNLGTKSARKGSRAGRLYIKRAIDDNQDKIMDQFKAVFRGI